MKLIILLVSVLVLNFANAGEYTASAASGYKCKSTGNGACAVSLSHGQCGPSWDNKDDGGMYACQLWTGEAKANKIDKSKYTCKDTGNGACAVNTTTGQCGPAWDDKDGGMYQCQKWTGEVSAKKINKGNYTCKKTSNGYCAQNLSTGQCTHEWNDKDGDAKFQCNNWLKK
jgi:hypothetical protein